jgi:integral membrane protein (TIGR00529 family)
MPFSASTLALGKLLLVFGGMLFLLRLRWQLWKVVFCACGLLALLSGLPPREWIALPVDTAFQSDFLAMMAMVFGIILLSGVQDATGQSRRLVGALSRCIRSPRVRLVFFPALVGLLPMPGGALYSCPMLDDAAQGMNVDARQKTLINYWFRHIWEISWPLYPGYVLISSLLDISLTVLLRYTFPIVICSFVTGWIFFIRGITPGGENVSPPAEFSRGAPGAALYEALPLIVTLIGAIPAGIVLGRALPGLPPAFSFILSIACGLAVALFQGRGKRDRSLSALILNAAMGRLALLLYAIFLFKNLIIRSGMIALLGQTGGGTPVILLLFLLLPFAGGMLTGVMVGFVGVSFPILLGLLAQSGLQEYLLPLVIAAAVAGNIGQLFTPLHACLALTCEYFRISFSDIWRSLAPPLAVQLSAGIAWCLLLAAMGVRL